MSASATKSWKHSNQAINTIARGKGQASNVHHFLEHRFGHPAPFSREEYDWSKKYWAERRAKDEEEVVQILLKREEALRQSAAYKQQIVNYYNGTQATPTGQGGLGVRPNGVGPGGIGSEPAGQYNGSRMDVDGPGARVASDRPGNDARGIRNAPLRGLVHQ
jgi:hypothetical protein